MSSDIQSNDLFNAAKSQLPKWAETLLKEEGFDPNANILGMFSFSLR